MCKQLLQTSENNCLNLNFQLQLLDADKRKLFFYTNFGQIQDMDDSEDVSDKFLKTLIMETACVGTDSSK